MQVTTYKEIKFKSGDIIPAGTEVVILPIRNATENLIRADMRIYTKDGDDVILKVTKKNGVYHVSPKEISDAINYCIEHSEE